jgi:hypothetical protein
MEVLQWLIVNTVLPLLPIAFFYLLLLLVPGSTAWVQPIRDGQICFYSTTIAIIAIKDILVLKPDGIMWFFSLVACWLLSFFVYCISMYTTIYPFPTAARRDVDIRVALTSIYCGVVTTMMVVGLRLAYGVLK